MIYEEKNAKENHQNKTKKVWGYLSHKQLSLYFKQIGPVKV